MKRDLLVGRDPPFSLFRPLLAARYALSNALLLLTIAGVNCGGWVLAVAIIATLASSIADEAIGDEKPSAPDCEGTFCKANLYAGVPLLVILAISHALFAARVATQPGGVSTGLLMELLAVTLLTGYQYALVGATVGHELVHRTEDPVAIVCSCLLLAFTFNTGFTIFHLRGHHRLVGLWEDPACARRDELWAAFLIRTTLGQSRLAYRFEAQRLASANSPVFSFRNRVLSRQLYSMAIAATAFLLGGAAALIAFFGAAFTGRCMHELVNYVQHYGLVRASGSALRRATLGTATA